MEPSYPLQILNNDLPQDNKINYNKKEYIFELNKIKYKLFIFIENEYINLIIRQIDKIPFFVYYHKYNLNQIVNIIGLNAELIKDLTDIIKLIDKSYINNQISIIQINDEMNIKIKIKTNYKEYESLIKLNKKIININEKLEIIINEIELLKNSKINIMNKIKEIEKLLYDLKDSINKKIKENEEIINKLKNRNEDNLIKSEKNKNEIQILKKKILNMYIKSKICKIILSSDKISYGFLMKSYKGENPFYFLISNNISESMIKIKEKIQIYYDDKKIQISLNEEERFIRNYKYINIDTTIIEILPKDNISENYFLIPYIDKDNNNLKNINIDIIEKEGDDINRSIYEIKSINQYEFTYISNKKNMIFGIPIFKDGTNQVIGITQKKENNENKNYGNFIWPIINSLKLNLQYEKIKYYNDDIYEGEIKNEKKEGYGKYIWKNGEYYIGEFLNDFKEGKGREYYKNNTIKYEGDFVNDKYEGNGKYIYENGIFYIGKFSNGLKHGKGIEYYKNNTIKYDGDFSNGKKEGFGKYIYESGNYYIGELLNGLKHGQGIEFYKDNTIKNKGNFFNGKIIK